MRVVNDLAVLQDLGADGVEDVGRLECVECRTILLGGKHDAVIPDANFDDVFDTSFGTGLDFLLADRARSVRDVDGVFANAFAEALQASGRTAGFNDRGREIGVFAKCFSDDRGIRKNRGRTGDLDLVTSLGCASNNGTGDSKSSYAYEGLGFHLTTPFE